MRNIIYTEKKCYKPKVTKNMRAASLVTVHHLCMRVQGYVHISMKALQKSQQQHPCCDALIGCFTILSHLIGSVPRRRPVLHQPASPGKAITL